MRRLAMGAVLGAVALGASFDSVAPGAASDAPAAGHRRSAGAAVHDGRHRSRTPSADDDMRAMREAVHARAAMEADLRRRLDAAAAPARAQRGAARSDAGVWHALGRCESNNNPRAVSASGTYRGAFQFSLSTWHSLGYGGDPIDHSYAVQLEAAKRLQARSGWGQWPKCSRRLGLR